MIHQANPHRKLYFKEHVSCQRPILNNVEGVQFQIGSTHRGKIVNNLVWYVYALIFIIRYLSLGLRSIETVVQISQIIFQISKYVKYVII